MAYREHSNSYDGSAPRGGARGGRRYGGGRYQYQQQDRYDSRGGVDERGGPGEHRAYQPSYRAGGGDRYQQHQHYSSSQSPASASASAGPEPVFSKPACPAYTAEEIEEIKLPIESFEDIKVNDNVKRGIFSYGFERPSSIQAVAIKPVISGKDVIAQAQSGMGKTGAFVIGTLGRVDENINATQAIVIAHTRELALQIDTVFRQIGKYTGIRFGLCLKGIPIAENIEKLVGVRGGRPHVVIGTPGRVLDMLNRKDRETGHSVINKSALRLMVVDEADELLNASTDSGEQQHHRRHHEGDEEQSGFLDQLFNIFKCMPVDIQVCLFSATMSPQFFETTKNFMREPLEVLVKTEELTLDGIKQYQVNVQQQEYKFETLCELYGLLTINQSIIYCNSLKSVEYLTHALQKNNFMVSAIHGHMTPQEREVTMAEFRNGKSRVLVSTDLLSRGIDVQQVSVVINYDVPSKIESYLHRIGRSGRYGRKGVAINFVTDADKRRVNAIEQYYSTMIDFLPANIQNLLD
jgi:translation initiation factor 4A